MKATAVLLSLFWGLAAAGWPDPAAAQPPAEVLVLTRANLIDGISAHPQRDMTVVVRDGRIERVSAAPGPVPPGATVIDLNGHWLLPGLIDAHVHLRDLGSARRALRSGVTTARSLGVNHFVDVGIRDLHRAGASDLPDVVAAGYHVRRHLAEEFFFDSPRLRTLMQGVSGPDDVRQVVRVMLGRGSDVIKVMVTERAGLTQTDPLRRVLADDELKAAVDEASRAGIPVAAHAHTDEGAQAAVRAGVRSLEHGTLLSEATLRLMKAQGTCFVPTISFWLDMLDPGGEYNDPILMARARAMLPRLREAVGTAWRLGVKIAAGSDMRYSEESHRRVPDEIEALEQSGLSPMGAIQAATAKAAECLGVQGRTGTITAGMEADLIAVDGDPLANIHRLREAVLIVNNGRVAVNLIGRPRPRPGPDGPGGGTR